MKQLISTTNLKKEPAKTPMGVNLIPRVFTLGDPRRRKRTRVTLTPGEARLVRDEQRYVFNHLRRRHNQTGVIFREFNGKVAIICWATTQRDKGAAFAGVVKATNNRAMRVAQDIAAGFYCGDNSEMTAFWMARAIRAYLDKD